MMIFVVCAINSKELAFFGTLLETLTYTVLLPYFVVLYFMHGQYSHSRIVSRLFFGSFVNFQ